MQKKANDILLLKSIAGDKSAFGELIECYCNYLFSVVFRLVCNEQEAEDIVQETFIRAWQKLDGFDQSRARFSTWLYSIATRLAIDTLRKQQRRATLDLDVIQVETNDVHQQLTNKEIGELIRQATQKLSHQQKVVFVLRDVEQLDVYEVVEITGYSEKQIKDNLYLARKNIRERLMNVIGV